MPECRPGLGGEHGSHDTVRLAELSRGPHCSLAQHNTTTRVSDTTCSHQHLSGQASTSRSPPHLQPLVLNYFYFGQVCLCIFPGAVSSTRVESARLWSIQLSFLTPRLQVWCEWARIERFINKIGATTTSSLTANYSVWLSLFLFTRALSLYIRPSSLLCSLPACLVVVEWSWYGRHVLSLIEVQITPRHRLGLART